MHSKTATAVSPLLVPCIKRALDTGMHPNALALLACGEDVRSTHRRFGKKAMQKKSTERGQKKSRPKRDSLIGSAQINCFGAFVKYQIRYPTV